MSIAEDHKKPVYALGARDVRRLTAVMQRLDLVPVTYSEIVCYLDQFEARLLSLAFVSCHLQGGEEVVSLVDHQGLYDDGRPVATTIRSDDGFVTMVHDPAPSSANLCSAQNNSRQNAGPRGSAKVTLTTSSRAESRATTRTSRG